MTTHSEAKAILERAVPGIDPRVSLLVRAVSVLESHYGDGWGKGTSTAGVGSNNWGAIVGTYNGGYFEHADTIYKDGKNQRYVTKFRAYPTPEEGARDLYELLSTGRHARAAALAKAGRFSEISAAMGPRGSFYYSGIEAPAKAEATHRRRLFAAIEAITKATGEPSPLAAGVEGKPSSPSQDSEPPDTLPGGFPETPESEHEMTFPSITSVDRVRDPDWKPVQVMLQQLKMYDGAIDGDPGPKTMTALARWGKLTLDAAKSVVEGL